MKARDVLTVTRVDRLARSIGDLQDIVREMKAKGAHLRATEQPIDTSTAAGKAFLDMLGAGFTHQTYLSLKTGPQSALRSLTGLVLRWLSQGIGGAERLRNHPKHRTADPYA